MARPVPVLPEVGSTIVPPGRSSPSRSAASIIAIAARSLIEPPGLRASTLATICGVSPAPRRDRRTSGVSPMASMIESRITAGACTAARSMGSSEALVWRSCQSGAGRSISVPKIEDRSGRSATMSCMPNDLRLDNVDRSILEALSENARLPNNRLAERVGVAPSTALQRVRALREAGVLRGFHAEIDLAALGRPVKGVAAGRLAPPAPEQTEPATGLARQLPGVRAVSRLAGAPVPLVWLAAADAQDLGGLVVDHLATPPAVA